MYFNIFEGSRLEVGSHGGQIVIGLGWVVQSMIRGPTRGVSQVACRNFKMSRVGILSRLRNAVGNLATYIWLRQSFVAISFEPCRYFLAHVACWNLPWQGL